MSTLSVVVITAGVLTAAGGVYYVAVVRPRNKKKVGPGTRPPGVGTNVGGSTDLFGSIVGGVRTVAGSITPGDIKNIQSTVSGWLSGFGGSSSGGASAVSSGTGVNVSTFDPSTSTSSQSPVDGWLGF